MRSDLNITGKIETDEFQIDRCKNTIRTYFIEIRLLSQRARVILARFRVLFDSDIVTIVRVCAAALRAAMLAAERPLWNLISSTRLVRVLCDRIGAAQRGIAEQNIALLHFAGRQTAATDVVIAVARVLSKVKSVPKIT